MKKNRILWALVGGLLACILAPMVSNYFSVDAIGDAAVKPNNGNIALAYNDPETSNMRIEVYDCEGNPLWQKSIYSAGGTFYIAYDDQVLHVYVVRTDMWYTFDDDGNKLSETEDDGIESKYLEYLCSDHWKGWDEQWGSYAYTHETLGVKYVYQKDASFIKKGSCILYIENSEGGQVVLYEDGKHS